MRIIFAIFGVVLLVGCISDEKSSMDKIKTSKGKELYTTHCSECHQSNGKGIGLVFLYNSITYIIQNLIWIFRSRVV